MEKYTVQCEDGRRREARVYEEIREEGAYKIWKAGVRVKGKHVNGEAWHSQKTENWYFVADLEDKNSDLLAPGNKDVLIRMKHQLRNLEAKYAEEKDRVSKQVEAMLATENEIKSLQKEITGLIKRVPEDPEAPLQISPKVRTS